MLFSSCSASKTLKKKLWCLGYLYCDGLLILLIILPSRVDSTRLLLTLGISKSYRC
uniref:Uncharacterized protein n=1 Tax=Mus musculus TaxID=10090 RepID=Q3TA97_MOUSE|nr:unnamed protein product [Mus musculus]